MGGRHRDKQSYWNIHDRNVHLERKSFWKHVAPNPGPHWQRFRWDRRFPPERPMGPAGPGAAVPRVQLRILGHAL